ncbi:MAG: hypothetical protein QXF49_04930 [Thermosphaera sp.]
MVLDHYYVRTTGNCYGVIVGNDHAPFYYIGYLKYCQASVETLWRNSYGFYTRLVKIYTPSQVHESTGWKQYIPYYDSLIPIIPSSVILEVYDPIMRTRELFSRPTDPLETEASRLLDILHNCTGLSTGIGVTGSLLPRIHNPFKSDIDLVVYGWRESVKAIECLNEVDLLRPFEGSLLREWALRVSENTGISVRTAEKLYRKYRRGLFHSLAYSIIFDRDYGESILLKPSYHTLGVIIIVGVIEGGLEALSYPSSSKLSQYVIVKSSVNPPYPIDEIVSFDSLYIPVLFEGGKALIKGLLQCSSVTESCRILVGGVEEKGFIEPE